MAFQKLKVSFYLPGASRVKSLKLLVSSLKRDPAE